MLSNVQAMSLFLIYDFSSVFTHVIYMFVYFNLYILIQMSLLFIEVDFNEFNAIFVPKAD